MSKETQIEEIAKIINKPCVEIFSETGLSDKRCPFPYECNECTARRLYDAGYRKSEWISIEERLPEESGKYLVCIKSGNVYQTKFYSYPKDKGGHWGQKDKGKNITHWMPLPEAPKGGADQ